VDEVGDECLAQPAELHQCDARREVRREPAQAVARRHGLTAPRQQEQQRAAAQPPAQIGQDVQCRLVRGVDVVDEHDAAGARRGEHGGHAIEQSRPRPRTPVGERDGRVLAQPGQLGREQRRVGESLRRHGVDPALGVRQRGREQADDRPVRQPGLVLVAARGEHHRAGALGQLTR
jgi:hypothetical protein